MANAKRTTVSIPIAKKLELQQLAIEISYKSGSSIQWTDIVHYMMENYKAIAKRDMIEDLNE